MFESNKLWVKLCIHVITSMSLHMLRSFVNSLEEVFYSFHGVAISIALKYNDS